MRTCFLAAFAASLIFWSSAAWCQDEESALGDPTPPAVQDPSLANSRIFPASLGTTGVAAVTAAPKPSRPAACNPANPCAMPTPAQDRVVIARP